VHRNLQAYSILQLKVLAADDEVGAWHAAATSAGRAGGVHQFMILWPWE